MKDCPQCGREISVVDRVCDECLAKGIRRLRERGASDDLLKAAGLQKVEDFEAWKLDEAKSIIKRLVVHLDATLEPGKWVDKDGNESAMRRDWLWEVCFGQDHELYDDIYACVGGRFVHDRED